MFNRKLSKTLRTQPSVRSYKSIMIIALIILLPKFIFSLVISGQVLADKKVPLSFVNVQCENRVVTTNQNGKFVIKVNSLKDTLKFYRYGFKEKKVEAEKFYQDRKIYLEYQFVEIEGMTYKAEKSKSILKNSPNKITIKVNNENGDDISSMISGRSEIEISGNNLAGEDKQVSFPGFKSRHTLVMIDNIPVNHAGESFDISSIPAEIIESIEIVKGSSAAAYGSGAMGGIINVITKKGNNDYNTDATQTVGSFGHYKSAISHTFTKHNFRIYNYLSHNQAKNDFLYKTRDSWGVEEKIHRKYNDKIINQIHSNINFFSKFVNVENQFRYNQYLKKLPGHIQNLSIFRDSRTKGESYNNFLSFAIPAIYSELNLFISKDFNIYDNTRLEYPFNLNFMYAKFSKNYRTNRGFLYRLNYAFADFETEFGADYKYEDFEYKEYNSTDDSLVFVPMNSISKIFHENFSTNYKLNYTKEFDQFSFSINQSTRKDFPLKFDDFVSWNISPEVEIYSYIGNFNIGGSIGEAFTLPSFYNLYWKGDSQTAGNADLLPEESSSKEGYLKFSSFDQKCVFSYQDQNIKNMIIWAQDFNQKWKPMNVSAVKIQNLQAEISLKLTKFWGINSNYIRTITEDRTRTENGDPTSFYGKEMIYTPKYNFTIENQFKCKNFSMKFQYKKTGSQWSTRDQLSDKKLLPAYEIMNLSGNYSWKFGKMEIVFGVDLNNLQNNLYEIYKYIPQPGFNWNVATKIKYKIGE